MNKGAANCFSILDPTILWPAALDGVIQPRRPVVPRPLLPDLAAAATLADADDPGCPVCGGSDGYLNVAHFQYAICAGHGMWWFIGKCLTDSWVFESRDEQDRVFEAIADNFRHVTNGQNVQRF